MGRIEYGAGAYVHRAEVGDTRMSMSVKGNPYDDARTESFFKTAKSEEERKIVRDSRSTIEYLIEDVYNQ